MRICALLLFPLLLMATDKIVFDTDCGFFGDDGSALVLLARSPEKIEIAAITTVSGNVWAAESEGYLREILHLLGRSDLQPRLGAQMPLIHTPSPPQADDPIEFQGAFGTPRKLGVSGQATALEALARTIRDNPGRITILALGPMTNIAMLLRLEPGLETAVRRIVFMGGNVHVPGNASRAAEFNFWFDPEAAQMVLRSKIPEKVMFPLDICNRARLTKAVFDEIVKAKTPVTQRYRQDFGTRYPGFLEKPDATGYLWDELAAAWLIDPGFVTKSETLYLDIDTRPGPRYGATTMLERKIAPEATPVEVMLDLDLPRAFTLYKSLLMR